jgi:hypothetical protein
MWLNLLMDDRHFSYLWWYIPRPTLISNLRAAGGEMDGIMEAAAAV